LLDGVCELVPDPYQFVGAAAPGEEHLAADRCSLRAACMALVVMDRDVARGVTERSRRADREAHLIAPMVVLPLRTLEIARGVPGERVAPRN
jgi:hypothetical protein